MKRKKYKKLYNLSFYYFNNSENPLNIINNKDDKKIKELEIKNEKENEETSKKNKEDLKSSIEEQRIQEDERINSTKKQELLKQIIKDEDKKKEKIMTQKFYYKCHYDQKVFESEEEFANHYYHCHLSNKFPFYCNICKRGFYIYSSLLAHNKAKGH